MAFLGNAKLPLLTRAYLAFTAGAMAGTIQAVIIWLFGQIGLFILVRLPLAPVMNLPWLYKRTVWGGLWGLVFLLPLLPRTAHWKRGLLFGLVPALATMLYFSPYKGGLGFFGLSLGPAMPGVVVFFGIIWGLLAGFFLGRVNPPPDGENSE